MKKDCVKNLLLRMFWMPLTIMAAIVMVLLVLTKQIPRDELTELVD